MADTPTQAPAAATPPPAPAAAATEPPKASPFNAQAALDNATPEELDMILQGLEENRGTPPAETATPVAEAPKPEVEKPAAEVDEDDELETGVDDEHLPKRIRVGVEGDPILARALLLRKKEPGISFMEAWKRAGGKVDTAPAEAPKPQEQAPQPPPAHPRVVEIDSTITQLRAQQKEARAAYEYGKADDLGDQILDLVRERAEVNADYRASLKESAALDRQVQESEVAAIAQYPDAGKEGTPLYDELVRENIFMREVKPDFFNDPKFPLKLIEQVKARRPELFEKAAPPPAAAPQPALRVLPPVAAPPVTGAAPVSGTATTTVLPSITSEQGLAEFEKLTPEEQSEVLVEIERQHAQRHKARAG
jgi:hypothetical protein